MSPKPKKKSQSSLEQYQNMTLEELANLENSDDEEIDEETAFSVEDEKEYGKYFSSSPAMRKTPSKNLALPIRSKNLSLPIPLKNDANRYVEIAKGSKMTLSSVCLDVSECQFETLKLVYRCAYPNQGVNEVDDFCCLCNYLSPAKGGMGLVPSNLLSLEVIGPCKAEFRIQTAPSSHLMGNITLFGVIMPVDNFGISDDETFNYAEAIVSEEAEIATVNGNKEETKNDRKDDHGKSNGEALKANKKRKLEVGNAVETETKQSIATATMSPANQENSEKKLTKSQRKRLAKEKAKQLEETLSAARNDTNNDANTKNSEEAPKKKSKKKKKKQPSEGTDSSKPTPVSVTRERRLAGGLVVADMLLGTGAPVRPGKRISLHYTGSLRSTGKVFDKNSSKQHPLVFRQGTGEVIRGLDRGMDGMRVGGERVITIPSKLGYGTKGQGVDIPPDADLVFEVKVLKVG